MSITTTELLAQIRRLAQTETEAQVIRQELKVLITGRYRTVKGISEREARKEIDLIHLEVYYSAEDRRFLGEYVHTKCQDDASKDARKKHKRMKDNLRVKYNGLVSLMRKRAEQDPETGELPEELPEDPHPMQEETATQDPEPEQEPEQEETATQDPEPATQDPLPSDPHTEQEETPNQDPEAEQEPEEVQMRDCPICLDTLPLDAMMTLECDHVLCLPCMGSLIAQRRTPLKCCMCRDPITRPVRLAFRQRVELLTGTLLV